MRDIKVNQVAGGFMLVMDGKPLKTPLGREMVVPGRKLADAIAREWQAQGDKIRKETMRLTQVACVAIDIVPAKREAMLEDILPYADTDLLCYHAGDIPELLALQKSGFEPLMQWAEAKFGIRLHITDGIMPVKQEPENRQKIAAAVAQYNAWQLAVFTTAVKPLASIILALAFTEGRITAKEAFHLAHLEETHQTGKWGEDEEKEQKITDRKLEIEAAGEFLGLLN